MKRCFEGDERVRDESLGRVEGSVADISGTRDIVDVLEETGTRARQLFKAP